MSKDNNSGAFVEVHGNSPEALDKAIKKLKKKLKKSNLMVELFESQFFKKPSDKKREKKMKAIARNRYRVMEERQRDLK